MEFVDSKCANAVATNLSRGILHNVGAYGVAGLGALIKDRAECLARPAGIVRRDQTLLRNETTSYQESVQWHMLLLYTAQRIAQSNLTDAKAVGMCGLVI